MIIEVNPRASRTVPFVSKATGGPIAKAAVETLVPSAYTNRVKLVVVESGPVRVKLWVDVERNVARDFRAAFGKHAPPVSGIAIATDTDNTGAVATAFFGDIFFYKQKVKVERPGGDSAP